MGLFVVGICIVGFIAVSAFFARQFTSPKPKPVGDFAPFLPATTQAVRFTATDGVALAGWFTPSANNTKAVVLLHGNGSTRRQMLARAGPLHGAGYAVLLYDARGHGESGGALVSVGKYETRDLLGALAFVRAQGAREIGLVGVSQGGATIALAGASLGPDIRWAVLESVYPNLRDAVDRRFRRMLGIPGWLGGILMVPIAEWRLGLSIDDIAPLENISRLPCPVFFLHGAADTHTLGASARALFDRAPSPKKLWLVPGAGHVDLYGFAKGDYEQQLLGFIAEVPSSFSAGPRAPTN
ncbi:MAG TPA: alpha/beta fold hydrolase [Opitutaceae bacterium]